MNESRVSALSAAAYSDSLYYSAHYNLQLISRPTPSKNEILFLLCQDAPEIIEDYPQDLRGPSCLIWGLTDDTGRVGHLVCSNPPNPGIITAYYPSETEPNQWECNYRRRIRRQPQ